MSINFNNAIVRLPSETIINAISSKGLSPDFLKVKIQHQAYSDTLKEIGLKVKILNPLKIFLTVCLLRIQHSFSIKYVSY